MAFILQKIKRLSDDSIMFDIFDDDGVEHNIYNKDGDFVARGRDIVTDRYEKLVWTDEAERESAMRMLELKGRSCADGRKEVVAFQIRHAYADRPPEFSTVDVPMTCDLWEKLSSVSADTLRYDNEMQKFFWYSERKLKDNGVIADENETIFSYTIWNDENDDPRLLVCSDTTDTNETESIYPKPIAHSDGCNHYIDMQIFPTTESGECWLADRVINGHEFSKEVHGANCCDEGFKLIVEYHDALDAVAGERANTYLKMMSLLKELGGSYIKRDNGTPTLDMPKLENDLLRVLAFGECEIETIKKLNNDNGKE